MHVQTSKAVMKAVMKADICWPLEKRMPDHLGLSHKTLFIYFTYFLKHVFATCFTFHFFFILFVFIYFLYPKHIRKPWVSINGQGSQAAKEQQRVWIVLSQQGHPNFWDGGCQHQEEAFTVICFILFLICFDIFLITLSYRKTDRKKNGQPTSDHPKQQVLPVAEGMDSMGKPWRWE